MVYICEWPFYQKDMSAYPDIVKTCHVFRNHMDIFDRYTSVQDIINDYATNNQLYTKYSGNIKYYNKISTYNLSNKFLHCRTWTFL